MNTQIFENQLQAMLDDLTAEIAELQEDLKELEDEAQAKRDKIDKKAKEMERFKAIIDVSLEFAKHAKTLEEIASNALGKDHVKEVLDDLETQGEPDFKSAKLKLGIEVSEQEDPPTLQEAAQAS